MSHLEGYDALEGDTGKFIDRFKEIWEIDRSKSKGAPTRYGLTIGIRNHRAEFAPTVTTGKGVMTLIAWNLATEDMDKIKKAANEAGLSVSECPYLWFESPTILPEEMPSKSLPSKSAK